MILGLLSSLFSIGSTVKPHSKPEDRLLKFLELDLDRKPKLKDPNEDLGTRTTYPKALDKTLLIVKIDVADTKEKDRILKIEPEMLLSMEDRRKIAEKISEALKGKFVSIRTARAGVINELDQDLKWLGKFDRCYINGVGSNNLYAIQLCFYDSNNEHLTYNYLLGPRNELGLTFTEKLVNLVSDEGHVITFPLDVDYKAKHRKV